MDITDHDNAAAPNKRGSPVLVRLAYGYICFLSAALALLLTDLLILHIGLLAGSHFEPNGRVFAVFFIICGCSLGLAEDRNIWVHEVRDSPTWLRWLFSGLFIYALMMILLAVVLGGPGPLIPANFFLAASAFMIMFSAGCACVLYVTFKSARSNEADLLARAKRSILGVTLMGGMYFLFSLFPAKKPYSP